MIFLLNVLFGILGFCVAYWLTLTFISDTTAPAPNNRKIAIVVGIIVGIIVFMANFGARVIG